MSRIEVYTSFDWTTIFEDFEYCIYNIMHSERKLCLLEHLYEADPQMKAMYKWLLKQKFGLGWEN